VPEGRAYFLRSERLGFRQWTADDLPLALALWGNADVTRLIGGPLAPDAVERRLRAEMATLAANRVQYWPIFVLDGDVFAGCAGLRPYRLEDRVYELGFHLLPSHWGRGLATEAASAVVAFAFGEIGAAALFAGHHPDNAVSRHVLEKLGFRFTHDEHYPPTGLNHPSYLLTRGN
jgi:ribosomal-protein-alanine N-acetyltransferase